MQFIAPFSWLISRTWFQFANFAISMYLFSCLYLAIVGFVGYGKGYFSSFKLDSIFDEHIPQGSKLQNIPNMSGVQFQLLLDGCTVWQSENYPRMSSVFDVHSITLTFDRRVAADGFTIVLPPSWGSGTPPSRLLLQGSNDGGASWSPVASSHVRLVTGGIRLLHGAVAWVPDAPLAFASALPWPLVLEVVASILPLATGCCAAAFCGAIHRPAVGRRLVAACAATAAACCVATVAGYLHLGSTSQVTSKSRWTDFQVYIDLINFVLKAQPTPRLGEPGPVQVALT
jgi:hypothetical protein